MIGGIFAESTAGTRSCSGLTEMYERWEGLAKEARALELYNKACDGGNDASTASELKLDAFGSGTIAVGPAETHAPDLFRRNTPTVTVSPQTEEGKRRVYCDNMILWFSW
jgi:TPR repeat protein